MSSKRAYAGNARLIEIGASGIPFRILLNIDKVENIRFEEGRQNIQVPNDDAVDAIIDPVSKAIVVPAVPPTMRTESVSTGWNVIIQQGGQSANIGFPEMEQAMNCYNAVVKMIAAVGIPSVTLKSLAPPKSESPIVGVDGEAIKEAVNAADLYPDLAGGEGDGIAPNDDDADLEDENFELDDEDLEALAAGEIGIDEEELEALANADPNPHEDPAVN
jgi:hypothetical protein